MNTINRVVIVILLLTLMVLLTTVFVLPHVVFTNVGEWMMQWGEFFSTLDPQWLRWVVGLFLALILDALIAFLIFLEVRRTRKQYIRVQQVTGGMATISIESIVQQLQYNLDPIADVIKVAPKVNSKRDKVQAVVNVEVSAGANVPSMATALMGVVQKVLIDTLGLQVYGQPEVRIKVIPGPRPSGKRPGTPTPEPSPIAPPVPLEEPKAWTGPSPSEESPDWAGPPPLLSDEEHRA